MTDDDIHSLLARIDERTEWICDSLEQLQKTYNNHDERLRYLEMMTGNSLEVDRLVAVKSAGVGGVGGGLITVLITIILSWIGSGGTM